ncbi:MULTISPECIES: hypothetical protein [Tsukamurella]|uniref:Uncharacterized protein n=2 Tax=Tsukamurella TaxID=2060 RepID=A0A5C5RXS1_9ACTN|nr:MULTISPECIES: hypothetical protein [Tsukamurella]NMD57880.1 hypothetical protein [Tsukamurella columbiensis]TWS27889.1 hypothetical protein FK530_15875 [Tsukamurella conjunctivitidis]
MTAIKSVLGKSVFGRCPWCRVILGLLLAMVSSVHAYRSTTLSVDADAAAYAGLGVVYGILTVMVALGERWAYSAALVFPFIALALGDIRSFAHYGTPMDAVDPFVDLLVVPVAAYVLRSTARGGSREN